MESLLVHIHTEKVIGRRTWHNLRCPLALNSSQALRHSSTSSATTPEGDVVCQYEWYWSTCTFTEYRNGLRATRCYLTAESLVQYSSTGSKTSQPLFTRATGPSNWCRPCNAYVTMANIMTSTKITGAQLNDAASTGVLFGQKVQKHANVE